MNPQEAEKLRQCTSRPVVCPSGWGYLRRARLGPGQGVAAAGGGRIKVTTAEHKTQRAHPSRPVKCPTAPGANALAVPRHDRAARAGCRGRGCKNFPSPVVRAPPRSAIPAEGGEGASPLPSPSLLSALTFSTPSLPTQASSSRTGTAQKCESPT